MSKYALAAILVLCIYMLYGCADNREQLIADTPITVPETTVHTEVKSIAVYKYEAKPNNERRSVGDTLYLCYPFTVQVYVEDNEVSGWVDTVTGRYLLVGDVEGVDIYATWNQGYRFGELTTIDKTYSIFGVDGLECEGSLM